MTRATSRIGGRARHGIVSAFCNPAGSLPHGPGPTDASPASGPLREALSGTAGLTVLETIIVLVMIGIAAALSYPKLLDNARRERARRSIEAVAREVSVARSYAIRSGRRIALIVDGANLRMMVRDTSGRVFRRLDLGPDRELRVESLDLTLRGDSILFSPRGFCLNCDPITPARIHVQSGARARSVTVNVLGRAEIVTAEDGS